MPPLDALKHYHLVLEWRQQQMIIAKTKGLEAIEMNRLTSPYPAEAVKTMNEIYQELAPLAQIITEKPAGTEVQAEDMIIPTIGDIAGIIEKLKILKEKETVFINEKCKDVSVEERSQNIANVHILKPIKYTGSTEELIKAAAGFDAKLSEKELLMEDMLALGNGSMPTKTLEEVVPTLPIDELRRLVNEFLPELLRNTEISADNKRYLHQIKKSISRELERKEKCKGDTAKLIETINQADLLRRQRKGDWPKDIKQLMNEIEKLLFPYLDYLEEKGTSGKWEQAYIEYLIKAGIPSKLDEVTQELEKIKYKIEVESQQSAPQKASKTKRNKKETKKAEKSEKKYQSWQKSGDACFIIEDNRIKFYYKKEVKDLRLRNETNPHKLLFLFAAKNPLPQVKIKNMCTEKTRPSDIAKQTNTKLNEKIAAMSLPGVPKDIEFVKYDNNSKCYGLWPEIKHKDDVDYE